MNDYSSLFGRSGCHCISPINLMAVKWQQCHHIGHLTWQHWQIELHGWSRKGLMHQQPQFKLYCFDLLYKTLLKDKETIQLHGITVHSKYYSKTHDWIISNYIDRIRSQVIFTCVLSETSCQVLQLCQEIPFPRHCPPWYFQYGKEYSFCSCFSSQQDTCKKMWFFC